MYEKPIEPYRKTRRAGYRLRLREARHVAPTEVRFESNADVKLAAESIVLGPKTNWSTCAGNPDFHRVSDRCAREFPGLCPGRPSPGRSDTEFTARRQKGGEYRVCKIPRRSRTSKGISMPRSAKFSLPLALARAYSRTGATSSLSSSSRVSEASCFLCLSPASSSRFSPLAVCLRPRSSCLRRRANSALPNAEIFLSPEG